MLNFLYIYKSINKFLKYFLGVYSSVYKNKMKISKPCGISSVIYKTDYTVLSSSTADPLVYCFCIIIHNEIKIYSYYLSIGC